MTADQPRPADHGDASKSGGRRRAAVALTASAIITGTIAAFAVIEGDIVLLAAAGAYWLVLALAYFLWLGWTANRTRQY